MGTGSPGTGGDGAHPPSGSGSVRAETPAAPGSAGPDTPMGSSSMPRAAISGTRAPFVTRYTLDRTSMAKASGNRRSEWMSRARNGQRAARPTAEATTVARRAPRLRSMSGPSAGATTAKGPMVNSRYSSTLSLAAVGEMEKNREPASETANKVSPAVIRTWVRARRPKGLRWSNRSVMADRARRRNWSLRSRTPTLEW